VCGLDEVSCTGCYWWLGDAGTFIQVVSIVWVLMVSHFGVFVLISLNVIKKPLVESSFLTRYQALSLWSGSADPKTLRYQRTNPREYQTMRTHTMETTNYIYQLRIKLTSTIGVGRKRKK